MDECDACGQRMIWAITPKGHAQPIDYAPHPDGNVLVLAPQGLGANLAVVFSGDGLKTARARGLDLRLPHHATCEKWADYIREARERRAQEGS